MRHPPDARRTTPHSPHERSHVTTAASAAGSGRTDRFWIAVFVRALVALAAAVAITADPEHSSRVGLLVFGCFAVAQGIVLVVGAFLVRDPFSRWLFVAQGALGLVVGAAAMALEGDGLGVFLYGVSVWALLTGFAELFAGWRARAREAASRDWMVTGTLTVVLAVVFLLIPPDELLADILFGVYAVIIAVYLGIAAFMVRLGLAHAPRVGSDDAQHQEHV
jgi:uncharacterized membrane protein HdeD (DUF308 family)